MLVPAVAHVVAGVLEVDFMDDEAAASAVSHHLDVLRLLHRLVIVQPRYLTRSTRRFKPGE